MLSILKKIISDKKKEVAAAKNTADLKSLSEKIKNSKIRNRNFKKAISSKSGINCIGELKKASPVKGFIRKDLDLKKTARLYEKSGIKAISVLTDKHFYGKLSDIKIVKNAVKLPVLRKDFIIDEYQIYESCLAGADAVLLIAGILSKGKLSNFLELSKKFNLAALIEVHDKKDLKKIPFDKAEIIGINNRNLKSFKVNLKTTADLAKKIPPEKIIVSESGIRSKEDIIFLKKEGADAFLIGESISGSKDIRAKIKSLLC